MKDEHVRDEHVRDAAQDLAEDVTQDLAEDVLGAACTPALAHTSSLNTDLTRNTRAPHSPRSTGFCAILDCISSFEAAAVVVCGGKLAFGAHTFSIY